MDTGTLTIRRKDTDRPQNHWYFTVAAPSMCVDSSHTTGGARGAAISWIVCPEKLALSTQYILPPFPSLLIPYIIPLACVAIIRG